MQKLPPDECRREVDEILTDLIHLLHPLNLPQDSTRTIVEQTVKTGIYLSRVQRPRRALVNKPLESVAKAAERLKRELKQLRSHPHALAAFWGREEFGPLYNWSNPALNAEWLATRTGRVRCGYRLVERLHVMQSVETVHAAAKRARDKTAGRPRDVLKQRLVGLALNAFIQCSAPTKRGTFARFNKFAEAFCLACGAHESVEQQIKRAWRARMKRGQK